MTKKTTVATFQLLRLDAIIIVNDNFNEVNAVSRAQNISGDAKYRAPSSIIYQR